MAEKETQIDSDNKEIKELKQKIVTMSEKLRCTEQSLIEQKHLVKEKDGKIVVSTLILKKRGLAVFNFFKNTWWNIYYRFINTPHQLQL